MPLGSFTLLDILEALMGAEFACLQVAM
jgi:hypothetical protein